jgi:hypothetical protein
MTRRVVHAPAKQRDSDDAIFNNLDVNEGSDDDRSEDLCVGFATM